MPELPEVEVTRRGIAPHLEHATIKDVFFDEFKLREPFDPRLSDLRGAFVDKVTRRGKYIVVWTDAGSVIIHLGMTGHLKVQDEGTPEVKHDHFALYLDNGKIIRLNDMRRFGLVRFVPPDVDPLQDKHLKDLGPEPLTDDFDGHYLYQRLQKIKGPVKPALMNSKVVVGVGNIYASEVLFKARVHPESAANALPEKLCCQLADFIKETLVASIEKGGTTIRDFSGADGKPGYFVQELDVYGHAGAKCKRCGHEIEKIVQAQRSTFFCPHCQKLYQ